jgi:hypothetical protein
MNLPEGLIIVATICNTVRDAGCYALWFSDGRRQCVVDLTESISDAIGLTGIAYHRGRIYVAVQGSPSRILVLDLSLQVLETIVDDDFNDLHSLHILGDDLVIVSPKSGKLLKRNLATGSITVVATFDPEAWVSVVLCLADDIWLCGHHLRYLDPNARDGGIFSIAQGRTILDGLVRPHSLMRYRDGFVVLDSGNARVVYFDGSGINHVVQLDGFLRGAAIAGERMLLVAGGPHRTISRKNPTGEASRRLRDVTHERLKIFEVDQGAHTRTWLPELPGFEIYDLLVLPPDVTLTPDADRVVELESGTFARFYYVTLVDALFRQRLVPPGN